MSILQLPNGRFRVQIRRAGFPKFDKVFLTREAAEEAQASVLGEQRAVTAPTELTLADAWSKYCQSQSFLQKASKTRSTEAGRIQPVLAELGSYSLQNLQNAPTLIYDYIDKRSSTISPRTKKKLSTTSVRLEVAALSAVVAFAKQRKIVQSNFVRQIDRPAQTKRKRRVDSVEVAGLREASEVQDNKRIAESARFFMLLRYLGCRPGELATLKRADINWRRHDVTFRDTKFKGEDRLVHVSPEALKIMDAQMVYGDEKKYAEYLFSTRSKQSSPDETIYVSYNYESAVKLMRKLGYVEKSFHAHAMRREYISRAIEAGMEYSTIRKQTGHHSTQAIEIYDEGLSTAPEIRNLLNLHEKLIYKDEVIGSIARSGASEDEIEAFEYFVSGQMGRDIEEGRVTLEEDADETTSWD